MFFKDFADSQRVTFYAYFGAAMAAPPGTRATLGIVRGADHEAKRSHEVLSRSGMVGSSVARRSSEEAASAAVNDGRSPPETSGRRPRRKRWEWPERTK